MSSNPQWNVFGQAMRLFVCALFLFQLRADAGGYLVDAWDSEKGLPDNFVTSVVQDPQGYLWVGTYNGLARFDGSRFVNFTPENTPQLGHARIVKLFLDAQGTLWINTYDGSLISRRNGVFTKEWDGRKKGMSEAWLVASNPREIIFSFRCGLLLCRSLAPGESEKWRTLMPPGSPPGAFYCMDQTGMLWCSTLDGNLWRINHDRFELMSKDEGLLGRKIHWVSPDLSGRIWVGTEKEMAMWNGTRFQNMTPDGATNLDVAFLSFLKDGGAVVAASGKLRKYFDGKWVAEWNAWPDLMQEQQLQFSLYEDREGGLWRVSRGLGLYHISPNGVTEQITVTNGLPGEHTTCCFEGREGGMWIGLGNNGLVRLRKQYFQVVKTDEPQNRPAVSVCEDRNGALWIGTYGGGLNRLQDGTLTHYEIFAQTPGDFVFSLCPTREDRLWISGGLEDSYIFENGVVKSAPVFVHGIKCIVQDKQGRFWIGRKDGVDRWADGKLWRWNSPTKSLAKRPVRAIVQDSHDNIWIGADDGNIYRVEGDALHAFPLPSYAAHQAVWSLAADPDGSLWIGTSDAGLLHFENNHFTHFTVTDGLPDNLISQILDDERGNLWLGSHRGICRVSKAALCDFSGGKTFTIHCSIYGRQDGLPTLQCATLYQPSAWRGHDGKLWFATAKGVVGVQPSEIELNTNPPPVVIEEFLVDGQTQSLVDGEKTGLEAIKVTPGKRNFEFRYTALSLTDSDKIRFQYKLEGFDSDWMDADTRRWVQYNYLKPQAYRFRVRACNSDGVWNETGASVDIKILPHFWETAWFRTLLGLVLTTSLAGAVRYVSNRGLRRELARLERQRDIEQDRARIARDIHDHIGSGLTRINLLNELLLGDPPGQLQDRVGQITGVTCELMGAMDEIVWAMNPKNDTLESLMSYLCDYADEYLRAAKIRLRLNLPTPLPAWHLTSEVRHNLFLAVKESLNNIVKHSQASEVFLTLNLNDDSATLEIRDNGRGIQLDSVASNLPGGVPHSNGNGLDNLQKRASVIGGVCSIRSEPGKGTIIELILPVPKVERMQVVTLDDLH